MSWYPPYFWWRPLWWWDTYWFWRSHSLGLVVRVDHKLVKVFSFTPGKRTYIMQNVTVGHEVDMAIAYLDQAGNPMLTAPTPDAPPVWASAPSAPGVDALTVAADGMTAVAKALAAGQDTISVDVKVGGKDFTATLQLSVNAAPQVLTSVAIASNVV
jgi:hypothetical protein